MKLLPFFISGVAVAGTLQAPSTAEKDILFQCVTDKVLVAGEETAQVTVNDMVFNRFATATYDNNAKLNATLVGAFMENNLRYTSLDTDIATVSSAGYVQWVSNGTARIQIYSLHYPTFIKQVNVTVRRYASTTVDTFANYVEGCLALDLISAIDGRLTNKSKVAINTSNGVSTWNPNHFAYDIDMTCVSITQPRKVLVAPRFIIGSEHYNIGTVVKFLARDNTVITRTVTATLNIGPENNIDGYRTDSYIGILNEAVPATITPCKFAPPTIESYLPSLSGLHPTPCIAWRQNDCAGVVDCYTLTGWVGCAEPTDATRHLFYEPKVSGDSSHPAFDIIHDEAVIKTQWTFGGAGIGPDFDDQTLLFATAMQTLAGETYNEEVDTITTVDLSEHPTY